MTATSWDHQRGALALKRGVDVLVAGAVLIVTLPVQVLAAIATFIEDGPPLFYRQRRAGLRGRCFDLLKLRTMRVHDTPAIDLGQVRQEHVLVTRTGRILRRLKIDELPQLLSVLRGDMSLVGPRPALPEQVELYDEYQRRRLLVRPGLTGWAQVNGNTELSWPERMLLDVWYIEHWSLWLDARILARTADVVLRGERANRLELAKASEHAERSRRRG